jgi:hypothetical protein
MLDKNTPSGPRESNAGLKPDGDGLVGHSCRDCGRLISPLKKSCSLCRNERERAKAAEVRMLNHAGIIARDAAKRRLPRPCPRCHSIARRPNEPHLCGICGSTLAV